MANKKVSQLSSKPSVLTTDIVPIADPTTGQLFKTTLSALGAVIGSAVASVNGLVGTVVLDTDDIQELASPTNRWFTDTRARAALSAGTGISYNSGTGVISSSVTLAGLGGVPTSRTLTINGTTYDLSADRSWSINSMVYPGAGIPISTGTAWGTSITDNSANWNTAYGWGNHAGLYLPIGGGTLTGALAGTSASFSSSVTGISFAIPGGTSAGFLKADGSVDVRSFVTTGALDNYLPLTGGSLTNSLSSGYVLSVSNVTEASGANGLYVNIASGSTGTPFRVDRGGVSLITVNHLGATLFKSSITANSFVKANGTSSEYLMADGSVSTGISFTYPGAGIAVSTGSAWGTSITDNSSNWNAAYSARIATFTTSGSSGSASFSGNTLNIPTYTLAGLGGQPAFTSGTGFVKISGTTISYDNTSYLPLTGGTLTGSLGGTSATFSGAVTSTLAYSNTSDLSFVASANIPGLNLRSSAGGRLSIVTGYIGADISSILVGTGTNNPATEALRIAHSNGSATFSSSVTANQLAIQTTPLSGAAVTILGNATNAVPIALINRNSTKRFDFILDVNAVDDKGFGIYDRTNGAYRFVLSDAGNVGIGTTAPGTYSGFTTLALNGVNGGVIDFQVVGTRYGSIFNGGSGSLFVIDAVQPGGNVVINTVGSERMRITSGGELLINGTYNPYPVSTRGNITLNGTGSNIIAFTNNTSPRGYVFHDGTDLEILNVTGSIRFYANNSLRLTINSTTAVFVGAITATSSVTASSFFESSDKKLKTLIEDNHQAKGIESITAKLYTKNGVTELGYYAQDVQDLLPSAVTTGADGFLNLSYREVHTAKIARLEKRVSELEAQLNLI